MEMFFNLSFLSSTWNMEQSDCDLVDNVSNQYNDSNCTSLYEQTTTATLEDPLSTWLIIVAALLASCTSLMTVSGNLIVLLSFFLERTIRQPTNYFIASLAMSDLLIGAVSMPFYTVYLLKGHHWPLGEVLCDLWLSVDYTVCLCSIYTVFCITIDRFCSVKLPAKYREWRTERKVLAVVGLTWVVPMFVFFPSIFGWQSLGERTIPSGRCYVQYMEDALFNCLLQVGYFWVTLCVMCALYAAIYRVALNLQLKSDRKRSKTTSSFVSVAGQKFAQIGVGLTEAGHGAGGVLGSALRQSGGGERTDANKQDDCGVAADRCSSPDYPSDVDSANETVKRQPSDRQRLTSRTAGRKIAERPVSNRRPVSPRSTLHSMLQTSSQATSKTTSQIVSQTILPNMSPTHISSRDPGSVLSNGNAAESCKDLDNRCDGLGNDLKIDMGKYEKPVCSRDEGEFSPVIAAINWGPGLTAGNALSDNDMSENVSPLHGNGKQNVNRHPAGRKNGDNVRLIIRSRDSIHRERSFPRQSTEEHLVWKRRRSISERLTLVAPDSVAKKYDAISKTSKHHDKSQKNFNVKLESKPSRIYSQLITMYNASKGMTTYRMVANKGAIISPPQRTEGVGTSSIQHMTPSTNLRVEQIELQEETRPSSQIGLLTARQTSRTTTEASALSTTSFYAGLVTRRVARNSSLQNPTVKKSKSANRAKKALRTITIILGAFVCCWTPWHILSMMIGFCTAKDTSLCVTPILYDISYWLCYLNSPLNPFCYALANQQFKKTFTRILRLDWHRT